MAKTKKRAAKRAAKKSAKTAAIATKKSAKSASKSKMKTARTARKAAVPKKVDPLNRSQYGALTPLLVVRDIPGAADFYKQAFGFKLRGQLMPGPDGKIMHAELKLRDATLMLGPEERSQNSLSAQSIGNTPATLYLLVDNVDKVYQQAVAAGGQTLMPVMDMFWGDRVCMIGDPEGNKWMVATHKSEPTPAQMRAEMESQMQAHQAGQQASAAAASESEY
jgi:uncharacterized glyoxalase superfamily protein PhnB